MGMNCKNRLKAAAACVALLGCLSTQSPAFAVQCDMTATPWNGVGTNSLLEHQIDSLIESRATETYNIKISGNTLSKASSSFSMSAGETITIDAIYSPSTAELDVGLIYADGSFHYFTTTGGRISKTIEMTEAGTYALAIRNNASYKVTVSGSVNY
ncbi:hypothetical protein [uncultured Flavonifractor sp.]|uniref:hypothetical protein n=1 Tax=uncultured Flavonifractor sp. TaxID=1193534 RepID=UPI00262E402B|nr:hypothetical protein [uncultured Flavonifractor sp.]